MGSRRGWPRDLADRCIAVGWEAGLANNGHYKVKTHYGKYFSFAGTPGSYDGEKKALSIARRHGLFELEEKLKLQQERDRLQAIEDDKANGVDWDAEEKIREEETKVSKTEGSLGYVGDVAIAEIAPAMYAVKRDGQVRETIPNIQELLLADGTVMFRCDMDSDTGPCHQTYKSAAGVSIHQARTHKGTYKLKPKNEPVKIESYAVQEQKTLTTIEDRITNLKEGESITVKADVVVVPVKNEAPEIIEKQPGIIARLVTLASEFDELVDEASAMTEDMRELTESIRIKRSELRKLLVELPNHLLTDEVKEKLETYEQLKSMLK